jgi:hypothetical protein
LDAPSSLATLTLVKNMGTQLVSLILYVCCLRVREPIRSFTPCLLRIPNESSAPSQPNSCCSTRIRR